jgi:hypothetical protein
MLLMRLEMMQTNSVYSSKVFTMILSGNTYPNFQTLVNRAILLDNMRKEQDRKGECKDRVLAATHASVLIHSMALIRGFRDRLVR